MPAINQYPQLKADDGASNVKFTQAGVSATPRSVQDKLRDVVSVKDFGAVGNGIADDTIAIQAAVTAAATAGAELVIPGGNYLCNSRIALPTGTRLRGPGTLVAGAPSGFGYDTHVGLLYAEDKDNISIVGLGVDVSAWTTLPPGAASARAILFRQGAGLVVEDCAIRTTGGAVAAIGCTDIKVEGNNITCTQPGVDVMGFADGVIDIWVEFDIDAQRCVISNNQIKGNGWGRWGIMVTGLTFVTQVMEARMFSVTGNIIENVYYDGIWVFGRNALLDGITITGNVIRTARKGISISDAINFSIVGNSIAETTSQGIHLWSEVSEGGTVGASRGVVATNALKNVASAAGTTPAIWLQNNSTDNAVVGNVIGGTTHYFGIVTDTLAVRNVVSSNRVETGRGASFVYGALGNLPDAAPYTPIFNGVTNVTTSTHLQACFHTASDRVFVFFSLQVQPTTGGVFTRLGISLPVASNLGSLTLFGAAVQATGETCMVTSDATNDRAELQFTPASSSNRTIQGWFSYAVI